MTTAVINRRLMTSRYVFEARVLLTLNLPKCWLQSKEGTFTLWSLALTVPYTITDSGAVGAALQDRDLNLRPPASEVRKAAFGLRARID